MRHFGDGTDKQRPKDEYQCDIDYEAELVGKVILRCGPDKLLEGKNEEGEDNPISHSRQNHPCQPGSLIEDSCLIFRRSPRRIKGHNRCSVQRPRAEVQPFINVIEEMRE